MLGKMSHRRKEEHGKKLRKRRRRNCVKTETDREAWLLDNPHKMAITQEEVDIISV
jgi:hypothetical protein